MVNSSQSRSGSSLGGAIVSWPLPSLSCFYTLLFLVPEVVSFHSSARKFSRGWPSRHPNREPNKPLFLTIYPAPAVPLQQHKRDRSRLCENKYFLDRVRIQFVILILSEREAWGWGSAKWKKKSVAGTKSWKTKEFINNWLLIKN